ncbi:hypothetical protein SAMN04488134_103192 [Amphibacillus marinus]|uniref:Uncharacterized protein n=1 Tax=Amphibacillus marinus TaxID=872970 RepID=A0A1H8LFP6_9BACI|nr:hypothetical protein [Amphibacillus marinus]SEO03981.1 hypothetical protein SAMN04488134_103192 [Amphibacillus marinus]
MNFILINLFILILLVAGILFLQWQFSKSNNKYLGLIIPLISFMIALLMTLGLIEVTIIKIISTFIMLNLPTLILLAIYLIARERIKRHSQLNKTIIKDLD